MLSNYRLVNLRYFVNRQLKNWKIILAPFLVALCIDWVMKNTVKDQTGIRWTLSNMLSDFDFVDDICLLAYRHTDMQAMTKSLSSTAAMLGLKVSTKTTKHMRMNHRSDAPIIL